MSYTLITIDDVVAALGMFFSTLGEIKNQIIHGAFVAVGDLNKSFFEGNIVAIVGLIGIMLILWRLRSWLPGFIKSKFLD